MTKRRMTEYVTFDRSDKPLIIMRINPISPDDQQFDQFLDAFSRVLRQRAHFRLLVDAREAKLISWGMLKRLVPFLKKHERHIDRHVQCSAIVVSNTLVRMLMSSLLALRPMRKPNKISDSWDEAHHWILRFDPGMVDPPLFFE